jgi:septal ring factor EnvC (AmiA/AmiB activator)
MPNANRQLLHRHKVILISAGLALAAPAEVNAAAAPSANTAAGNADASPTSEKDLERQAAERAARIGADLRPLRQTLTAKAAEIRSAEENLSSLEAETAALNQGYGKVANQFAQDREKLARLTAGLVRLARMPSGAFMAWEGAPIDAARAQILVRAATSAARDQSKSAEAALARMDDVGQQLVAKRAETEQAADTLKRRQAELAELIGQRALLYLQIDDYRSSEEKKAAAIAGDAADLHDLVARIEAAKADAARRQTKAQRAAAKRMSSPSLNAGGPAQARYDGTGVLPAAGRIKFQFGQIDGAGAASHGITIATRLGATVTAPASGIVRFAGPFRGYRQILILEHPSGYLTLIAGLARVTAPIGAVVGLGEPVGMMDYRSDSRPELYYELRRNGQLVDPQSAVTPAEAKGTVR